MVAGVAVTSLGSGSVAHLIGASKGSDDESKGVQSRRPTPTSVDRNSGRFGTVAEMLRSGLTLGGTAETLGYYAVNDGGGSSYSVVHATKKAYDLQGTGVAYRPVVSGVIFPKMFGTINDGRALDNWGLQRCYDYAADFDIRFIDGMSMVYSVGTQNSYDPESRGWSHSGAYVKAGRTLSNFRFRTASGSTNGTSPLTLWMEDNGKDIYLENVEIDGNSSNLSINRLVGREDGGCHGIHVYHPSIDSVAVASLDFFPCGNVYIRDLRMKNIYSYGGRVDHLDCLIELTDCDFDVAGIAFQAHSTRFVVNGANVTARVPRSGMVPDVFSEEIEFADAYSGAKKQSVSINRVRLKSIGAPDRSIFKIHYSPMRGVAWSEITVNSCEVISGDAMMVSIHNDVETALPIEKLSVVNPKSVGTAPTVEIASGAPDAVIVGTLKIFAGGAQNTVFLSRVAISEFSIETPVFDADHRIALHNSTIGSLSISNGLAGSLGVYGVIRDPTSTIVAVRLKGGDYTISAEAPYLIDANVDQIVANQLTIRPDLTGSFGTAFRTTATGVQIDLRDLTLEGSAYRPSSYLVLAGSAKEGLIYLNNVRHTAGISVPPISAPLLAPSRKVLINTSSLH